VGPPALRAKAQWQIITWGKNVPEWNSKLGVTGSRIGCSDTPASCVARAASIAREGVQVFLAVPLRQETVGYGTEYSKLAKGVPLLVEIGIDDLGDQYRKLIASDTAGAAGILDSFIDGVKSEGSTLKFGATIYEDDLDSPELSDAKMPASVRAKFDLVHLYLHYRNHAGEIPAYLQRAAKLFPASKIILGVYAYDRISYIPCGKGDSRPCSRQEEMNEFAKALDADIALLESGAASGLEFYPGSFGREDEWAGWERPGVCPGRKQECIDNTKAMRQMVADKLGKM